MQCCRTDLPPNATPEDKCRRYIGKSPDGCVGGSPPEVYTYSGAVARCLELSTKEMPLALCDIACGGLGCGYNAFPLYSSKPCAIPDLSPPPPRPALPSTPVCEQAETVGDYAIFDYAI